jgi:hypothetical protein
MASLCISPVHAGIMFFSTANSSFIFDLLLLSIKLCAVFLAAFRPAALVDEGCFLFAGVTAVDGCAAGTPAPIDMVLFLLTKLGLLLPAEDDASVPPDPDASSCLGFIWIIFLDRVGGGGSANCCCCWWSFAADDRLRDLTVSLAVSGYGVRGDVFSDAGGEGWAVPPVRTASRFVASAAVAGAFIAGGGNSKAICSVASCFPPS